jgi:RNA polymerase sigma factor (sigma-70 family)
MLKGEQSLGDGGAITSDSRYRNRSDEELVELCLQNDHVAWETLILRYKRLVYSIPRKCGLRKQECDEVFQETCLALSKGLRDLRDPGKIRFWIKTTAIRFCKPAIRKTRDAVPERQADKRVCEPLDPKGDLEQVLISAEDQQRIRDALEKWQNRCGLLLRMLYFEQRTYKEIADHLGLPRDGIGPRRAHCLDQFRRYLAGLGITTYKDV